MFVFLANFDILITHTHKRKKSQKQHIQRLLLKTNSPKSPNYEKNKLNSPYLDK